MKRNIFNRLMLLCFSMLFTITFISCGIKDKQTVISQNVIKDINESENLIKKNIELGNKLLEEGKYDDAKRSYEKAISMNINNKQTYLEIKDKYLEKERLDDGFYIIKLAVENNVDYSNMKVLLEEIKQKFEVTNIENSVYQNDVFTLPKDIKLKVNNEEIQATIKWSNSLIDTSKVGTLSYVGITENYERTVKLTLKVRQRVVSNSTLVTFKDKNLENKVRNAIDKPTGDLQKSDVEKITELGAAGESIYDLSGIENLINLRLLHLGSYSFQGSFHYNYITDVTPLKGLSKLYWLGLSSNKIRDTSPLKELSSLTQLNILECQIPEEDINSLKVALPHCQVLSKPNYPY